jgi:hypothetical protein
MSYTDRALSLDYLCKSSSVRVLNRQAVCIAWNDGVILQRPGPVHKWRSSCAEADSMDKRRGRIIIIIL